MKIKRKFRETTMKRRDAEVCQWNKSQIVSSSSSFCFQPTLSLSTLFFIQISPTFICSHMMLLKCLAFSYFLQSYGFIFSNIRLYGRLVGGHSLIQLDSDVDNFENPRWSLFESYSFSILCNWLLLTFYSSVALCINSFVVIKTTMGLVCAFWCIILRDVASNREIFNMDNNIILIQT